jgi:hypothetical protein
VIIEPGQNKDVEIAALNAQGYSVIKMIVTNPPPRVMGTEEELPPDIKLVTDRARTRERRNAAETRRSQPEERRFPLEYPKEVF